MTTFAFSRHDPVSVLVLLVADVLRPVDSRAVDGTTIRGTTSIILRSLRSGAVREEYFGSKAVSTTATVHARVSAMLDSNMVLAQLFESPSHELHTRAPLRVAAGYRYTMALTIDD